MSEFKVALGSPPLFIGDGKYVGAGEVVDIKKEDDPLIKEAIESGRLLKMEKSTKKGGDK